MKKLALFTLILLGFILGINKTVFAIDYELTFYTYDNDVIWNGYVTDTFDSGDASPIPTRTGYTFIGWYDDQSNEWRDGDQLTGNLEVWATYEINQYTITFDSNGGSAVTPITQDYDTSVTEPEEPSKDYYIFIGWYSDSGLTNAYTFTTIPAQDITLYAKWELIEYVVSFYTYDLNLINSYNQSNLTGLLIEELEPDRTGYTFTGWFDNQDNEWWEGDQLVADLNLIATYSINEYTVMFNSNGGSAVSPITQDYGSYVLEPTEPLKSGYIFGGWYSDVGLTTSFSFPYENVASVTVYAKWNIITVTFYTWDYDLIVVSELGATFDDGDTLPTPTRTGYTFLGWFDSLDQEWRNGDPLTENIIVYAEYTINQYTITFDSNGGSAVSAITQDYATAVTKPTNSTKALYTFVNWYSDVALTTVYNFTTMGASNITLYAKWTLTVYDVTFYTWDEQVIVVSGVGDYFEDDEALPPPTRTGYTFIGWFDSLDQEWRDLDQLTKDISVYATYTVNSYTITFNSNGGSIRLPITQNYGTAVTEPTDPSKQGYTFGGWYTEAELTNLYEFTTMGDSDITLYAKWNLVGFTVSFYTYNSELINTYVESNIEGFQIFDTAPARTGYTFIGWFDSIPAEWRTGDQLTGNISVYATYTAIPFTITFNVNGGTSVSPITQGYGTAVSEPAEPTKQGYEFIGWFTEVGLINEYTFTTMGLSNITLYAKWVLLGYEVSFYTYDNQLILTDTQDNVNGFDTSVVTPPLRSTYGFVGWFDSGNNEWREGDQLTGNISVYATYEQFDYNVFINVDTETLPINKPVLQGESFNSTYPSFLPPLKYGYVVMDYYKAGNININLPLDELNGLTLDELFTSGETLQASQLVEYDLDNKDFVLPNGVKFYDMVGGTYVQRVQEYTLVSGDIYFIEQKINVNYAYALIPETEDCVLWLNINYSYVNGWARVTTVIDDISNIGFVKPYAVSPRNYLQFVMSFGTSLATAKSALAGTKILYQLATPIEVFDIPLMKTNKQYSPLFNTTFDLMSDVNIKTQMDAWITAGLDTVIYELDILGAYSTAVAENWDSYYELYQEGLAGLFTTPSLYELYDMDEPINEDTYLYIMWELGLFTISFNSNGGSIVSTIAQLYNTVVNAPAPPTRTGYTFGGWYTETGLLNPYTFTTMSGENIILYAKWSINYYDVMFNSNGGTPVAPINDVMYNTGIDEPVDPTREFYNFNGWYISDKLIKKFNFDTGVITDDTVLYAKWTPDVLHGIDTNLDGTFLGTTLGKTIMVLVITAVVVIALGIFHAPMPVILVMLVMLLILFVTFGWIPIWLIILVAVILFLLLMFTTFGSKSSN